MNLKNCLNQNICKLIINLYYIHINIIRITKIIITHTLFIIYTIRYLNNNDINEKIPEGIGKLTNLKAL